MNLAIIIFAFDMSVLFHHCHITLVVAVNSHQKLHLMLFLCIAEKFADAEYVHKRDGGGSIQHIITFYYFFFSTDFFLATTLFSSVFSPLVLQLFYFFSAVFRLFVTSGLQLEPPHEFLLLLFFIRTRECTLRRETFMTLTCFDSQ